MKNKNARPTREVRNFILNKLIPFIRREQGRGFGMNEWLLRTTAGRFVKSDGIQRKVPVCGTVACIGGSIQCLSFKKEAPKEAFVAVLGAKLGLTEEEANGLFYNWEVESSYCWPESFQNRFAAANTARGKAGVACALLKKIASEGGKCLHGYNEEGA